MLLDPDGWRLWRDLRLAALSDAPDAFRASYSYWSTDGDTEANWRARLAARPLNVVITLHGEPAGMVSAGSDGDESVELHSMWVAPFGRGNGVGTAAVREVVAWAEAEHDGCPIVLMVMAGNHTAIRFYERHGFVTVGPSADHPDELVMRRGSGHG